MQVFARFELAAAALDPLRPALLLEGSWPQEFLGEGRHALDDDIDARDGWIDEEAVRLAEQVAGEASGRLAALNALPLRYYLAKLLRPVAWCEKSRSTGVLDLCLEENRDDDYLALLQAICLRHGWSWSTTLAPRRSAKPALDPQNAAWRRWGARLDGWLHRLGSSLRSAPRKSPRILLCGNPALLDPICHESLARGCQVAWIYDRFAAGTFLRWAKRGVRQLVCNSEQATAAPPLLGEVRSKIVVRGVDLSEPLRIWLQRMARRRGRQHAGACGAIERHIEDYRPSVLVVDEDATPLPRAAVLACRRLGVKSWVMQHGAPRVRFGFSPPMADGLLAWGESSRRVLESWGASAERVVVVGSPKLPSRPLRAKPSDSSQSEVLILATVPPEDARPDAVEFHLTSRAHDDLLRRALSSVRRLNVTRVTIKLHPRCRSVEPFRAAAAEFPGLPIELVSRADMNVLLQRASCVLNCCSSSGIEAAWHGVPVVELLPEGGVDVWPADEWGLFGSARTQVELDDLLARALAGEHRRDAHAARSVFARTGQDAARAAVNAVLGADIEQSANRQAVSRSLATAGDVR